MVNGGAGTGAAGLFLESQTLDDQFIIQPYLRPHEIHREGYQDWEMPS